ncbi:hypothetical protein NC653_010368 [Populus alba x Populus x berolinensis]|uniref:S-locus receptor kinase C-terminal domain-containing protein n=1 Tax=Populus alba x Populus x berolinensis TaxID=444605 RepID=A0AAD6W5N2_9ROSI|nr:hypothetical protein NC653_010368 [Populus alba x Populus x berolinensis]
MLVQSVEGAMEGEVAVGEPLVLVRGVGRLRWEELRERGVLVWLSEDDEGYDAVVLFLDKYEKSGPLANKGVKAILIVSVVVTLFLIIFLVWDLWREGRALELVDTLMGDSYPEDQVLRCIQIGLLCVQESAMDRPSMSDVVFMLSNDTTLPSPKQPAFIMKESYYSGDPLTSEGSHSINEVTITMLGPR